MTNTNQPTQRFVFVPRSGGKDILESILCSMDKQGRIGNTFAVVETKAYSNVGYTQIGYAGDVNGPWAIIEWTKHRLPFVEIHGVKGVQGVYKRSVKDWIKNKVEAQL